MDPIEVKPGIQSTELWLLLAPILDALSNMFRDMPTNAAEAISRVGELLTIALPVIAYISGRSKVKAAAHIAAGEAMKAVKIVPLMLITFIMTTCLAAAADYNFLLKDGKYYLVNKADPSQPNQLVTVNVNDLGSHGPVVVPPVVVPPVVVVPSGELSAVVKMALASIPDYPNKEQDRRALAYTLNFLSPGVTGANVAMARTMIRAGGDIALGPNKDKWLQWWTAVDAKLDTSGLTPASYSVALKDISTALIGDLPNSDVKGDQYGEPTFGLDKEFIKELIRQLLPILLKMLFGI